MTSPAVPGPAHSPTDSPTDSPPDSPPTRPEQSPHRSRDPLHGITLEHMVRTLSAHYGWAGLAERIPLRCFSHEPSVNSSLKLLRKTPWAREKVESLYLFMLREQRRVARAPGAAQAPPASSGRSSG